MTSIPSVGGIRLDRSLGEGETGEVFQGFDAKLERQVAVRILDRREGDPTRARLLSEGKALSRLQHSNICRLYQVIEEPSRLVLVMEYIEGKTLDKVQASLGWRTKLKIADQIARALGHVHKRRVVHGDIRAANVMITGYHKVKLVNFGKASILEDEPTKGWTLAETEITEQDYTQDDGLTISADMRALGGLFERLLMETNPEPSAIFKVKERTRSGNPVLRQLVARLKDPNPHRRPTVKETIDRLQWMRKAPSRRLWTVLSITFPIIGFLLLHFGTSWFWGTIDTDMHKWGQPIEVNRFWFDHLHECLAVPSEENVPLVALLSDVDQGFKATTKRKNMNPWIANCFYSLAGTVGEFHRESHHADQLKLLNEDSGDTHWQMTSANCLRDLCREHEAAPIYRAALLKRSNTLEDDHASVIDSRYRLAKALNDMGEYQEAQELLQDVITKRRAAHGSDHPTTLYSEQTYSRAVALAGGLEQAERLQRALFSRAEALLGPDHPTTLRAGAGLAITLRRLGCAEEAEPLIGDALTGQSMRLGPKPWRLKTTESLANDYLELGRYDAAYELYAMTLGKSREMIGQPASETARLLQRFSQRLEQHERPDLAARLKRHVDEDEHGVPDPERVESK